MRSLLKEINLTLISTVFMSSWLAIMPSAATPPLGTHINLSAIPNTCDLGGIRAKNGQRIRSGRLIRSAALTKLSHHDKWVLNKQHHVKVVLDFRSIGEIHQAPDKKLTGSHYHRLSVMSDPNFGVHTTSQYAAQLAAKQPNNMELFYQKMVLQSHSVKAYRAMFNYLLKQKSGAVLYHCTYGKDRTGIATMLILSSLGIPKATIMKNYLASNKYLKATTTKEYKQMKHYTHNRKVLVNLKRSKTAHAAYLNAAYAAVYHRSGSMKHYLSHEMRLSKHDVQLLRQMYLTK
ncbi:tyrosine-protein phosphatase [Lentilactobacillus otakiensis]|uniref:tyrosine-protein phosphatase n=1 Tax=Lentilactobacillus otakiensis TaxID=481720 RepID=UPI001CC0E8A5|nr:tyrosine-protein phosphatase [Lentilactobacillus otakiensis]MBZ3777047.1 tyrosine-protein phosphatase [Lentilactobacillus otakiensis]